MIVRFSNFSISVTLDQVTVESGGNFEDYIRFWGRRSSEREEKFGRSSEHVASCVSNIRVRDTCISHDIIHTSPEEHVTL
jgi:hypothetical protein